MNEQASRPSPRRWRRRAFIGLALALGLGWLGLPFVVCRVGGNYHADPGRIPEDLSPAARSLLTTALEGLPSGRTIDYHTHVIGLGHGGTGCRIHPRMTSVASPLARLRFMIYASAAGIAPGEGDADAAYIARLTRLITAIPGHGRHVLLPFAPHRGADGRELPEKTEFHVPNAYVSKIAAARPDLYVAAISIHPRAPEAVAELERWAARGGKLVKWLPNAMGIDPSSPDHADFYDRMKTLGLVLLSHAGEEQAVEADDAQELGNPLRLRRPLRHGVKVIVAHCASLGESLDLDDPKRPHVASFELFLRMLDEPLGRGLLFGELSATTQFNRQHVLSTLLARANIHDRLVNGSDYPLPAVNVLIRTRSLVAAGLLEASDRDPLNEIYTHNPLLFDLALKRRLKHPRTGARLPAAIFTRDLLKR